MLYSPEPSPVKLPVNDPVLYELLKDVKLEDKLEIDPLLVVILVPKDELSWLYEEVKDKKLELKYPILELKEAVA